MINIESNKIFETRSLMTVKIDGTKQEFVVTKTQEEVRLEPINPISMTTEDLKKIIYEMYCKGIVDQKLGVNVYLQGGKVIHNSDIMTIADDIKKAMGGDFTDIITLSVK